MHKNRGIVQNQLIITILFCLGWAVIYADRTVLYPMLPVIGGEFGLSNTQVGTITSTYFLIYVAMQIPSGLIGDRLGLQRLLTGFFLIAAAGIVSIALFASTYSALLLFVALHAAGAGSYYTAAYGITMLTVPGEKRGISTAIINSGMSLGLILGLVIAGPLYQLSKNWHLPFLILALPTFIMPVSFHLFVKPVLPQGEKSFQIPDLLRDRNSLRMNLVTFCIAYGFWVALTWGPKFFAEELGLSVTLSGVYTAVPAVAAIPAALFLAKIAQGANRKKLVAVLLVLGSGAIFLMAYVKSLVALVLVLIGYGLFGKLAIDPVMISWYAEHAAKIRAVSMGSAVGLFNFSAMLAAVVAPVISGLIRDLTGSFQWAFYLGAIMVLSGLMGIFGIEDSD